MQPSKHTLLMNYVIGLCKAGDNWVPILKDHGYEVQIIEQTVHCELGDSIVKPDVIVVSNVALHALVFEVKGGKTITVDQLDRYENLMPADLRYVTVHDKKRLQLDVGLCDFEENHVEIKKINDRFPVLVFSDVVLKKDGAFKLDELNKVFDTPISLEGKIPPTHYYPFSDDDAEAYIAFHIIRAMVSLLQKNSKKSAFGSFQEFKERFISVDDVVANKFTCVWKVLSDEQKKILKNKISVIIRKIFSNAALVGPLEIIMSKNGCKITGKLEQLERLAMAFIEGKLTADKGQVSLTQFTVQQEEES